MCVLIKAKRLEKEREILASSRERMKIANQRWKEIVGALARHGFTRTIVQVKSKWERLTIDFKKIFDYQRNKSSGQPGYFEMEKEQRLEFHLPTSFSREVYDCLKCWFSNQRAVNPPRSSLMDGSLNAEEEAESQARESQQTDTTDGNETGNDKNTPPEENGVNDFSRADRHGRRK
jgi:hypothetical protein